MLSWVRKLKFQDAVLFNVQIYYFNTKIIFNVKMPRKPNYSKIAVS